MWRIMKNEQGAGCTARSLCFDRSRRDCAERLSIPASTDLATVIRAWIDRAAIADALGLTHDQQVLLSQTVGYPKRVIR